jgi:hypothetical protein
MSTHLAINLGLPPWVLKVLEKNNERLPLVRHEFSARWEMFSGMGQCSKATGAQGSRDPGAKDFWPSAPLAVVVASVQGP